jgi:hypothetical protein
MPMFPVLLLHAATNAANPKIEVCGSQELSRPKDVSKIED